MKEVINYYNGLSSPVYACFMDASKAFDRVNHWHLFKQLLKRNMPKIIVRLLMVWYTTQIFIIKWDNNLSESFCVTNGVRHGGVLSPKLFNVFIEELSSRLRDAKVGCHMNGISMNHLNYADDAVMLAPSVSALQTLINICDHFANEYDMIYNVKKSLCTAFIPQMYGKMHIPAVMLWGYPS